MAGMYLESVVGMLVVDYLGVDVVLEGVGWEEIAD